MKDDSAEIFLQPFLQEAIIGRDVHPVTTRALPTPLGALKNSFGEIVMACDMPEEVSVGPQGS